MTKEFSEFKDRRRFVRVSIYAITRYYCPLRDREIGIQSQISNISEGGALLMNATEGIPLETSVQMSFLMPGDENQLVTVEGKVKHTGVFEKDLYRAGVEFFKLKKKDLQAIHGYVASHKKK